MHLCKCMSYEVFFFVCLFCQNSSSSILMDPQVQNLWAYPYFLCPDLRWMCLHQWFSVVQCLASRAFPWAAPRHVPCSCCTLPCGANQRVQSKGKSSVDKLLLPASPGWFFSSVLWNAPEYSCTVCRSMQYIPTEHVTKTLVNDSAAHLFNMFLNWVGTEGISGLSCLQRCPEACEKVLVYSMVGSCALTSCSTSTWEACDVFPSAPQSTSTVRHGEDIQR